MMDKSGLNRITQFIFTFRLLTDILIREAEKFIPDLYDLKVFTA